MNAVFLALSSKEVAGHDEQSPPPNQPQPHPQAPAAAIQNPDSTGTRIVDLGGRQGSDRHRRTLKFPAARDKPSIHAFPGVDSTDAYVSRVKAGSFAGLGGDSAAAAAAVSGVLAEVAETAAKGVWWKRSVWGWTDRNESTALWNKRRNLILFGGICRENDDPSDKVHAQHRRRT